MFKDKLTHEELVQRFDKVKTEFELMPTWPAYIAQNHISEKNPDLVLEYYDISDKILNHFRDGDKLFTNPDFEKTLVESLTFYKKIGYTNKIINENIQAFEYEFEYLYALYNKLIAITAKFPEYAD